MTEYVAKRETYFNGALVRKGEKIPFSAGIDKNTNFEKVVEAEATPTNTNEQPSNPDGKQPDVAANSEKRMKVSELREIAKAQGIPFTYKKGYDELVAELAKIGYMVDGTVQPQKASDETPDVPVANQTPDTPDVPDEPKTGTNEQPETPTNEQMAAQNNLDENK